jgi:uncharacterized protein (DUF2147 family)
MKLLKCTSGLITGALLALIAGAIVALARADEPTPAGLWKTVDDKTGKARGIIRIYELNGEIFGRIERSVDPKDAVEKCDKCSDERKDQPVIGLVILRKMKRIGGEYAGGDILDPETGIVYRCKLRVAEAGRKLVLRGYIGAPLFGRSQVWIREE